MQFGVGGGRTKDTLFFCRVAIRDEIDTEGGRVSKIRKGNG